MKHIPSVREEIKVENIKLQGKSYPESFLAFCHKNSLKPPNITSGRGKALLAMLSYPGYYFTRSSCDAFCKHFQIRTSDSIQLFNKHEQWGMSQSKERRKYYIPSPFTVSNKVYMRNHFTFNGTEKEKEKTISNIKKNILSDYIDVDASQWHLGHKNPDSIDNSTSNLILQPPIQAKYRDEYIFIDTLTKIPTPRKWISMHKQGKSPYTNGQLKIIRDYLSTLPL